MVELPECHAAQPMGFLPGAAILGQGCILVV
jgi:hypothetical protein